MITAYEHPPIPFRGCDWSATSDDYEPGMPIGYGATEQDAKNNLLELERLMNESH